MNLPRRLLFVFFMLSLTGCALTTTETARQLDSGDVVLSGSADFPGYAIIPKISGQATYGFGYGDISAHAGTALLYNNFGIGSRLYLSNYLNLSLQADFVFLRDLESWNNDWVSLLTLTPRLSTSTTDTRRFYAGTQANILNFLRGSHYYTSEPVGLIGLFAGFEREVGRRGLGMQFETILSPVFFESGDIFLPLVEFGDPIMGLEFSIAFFWRPGQEQQRRQHQARRPTPTASEPSSPRQPSPEEQRETAATQNEDSWPYSIKRNEIQRVIHSRLPQVEACYKQGLRQDRTLSGRITVTFVIDADGSPNQTGIEEATMNAPAVEECILEVIDELDFPAPEPGEEIRVDYPFNFSTGRSELENRLHIPYASAHSFSLTVIGPPGI